MKTTNMRKAMFLLSCILCGAFIQLAAQPAASNKSGPVKTFTFIARFIQPANSTQVYLNGVDYTVTVTRDSMVCDLPYRGVAYTAPASPNNLGLNFTSREFTRTSVIRKNGIEELRIEPKDVPGILWMEFSIARRGNTYLKVMPAQAQMVTFMGETE